MIKIANYIKTKLVLKLIQQFRPQFKMQAMISQGLSKACNDLAHQILHVKIQFRVDNRSQFFESNIPSTMVLLRTKGFHLRRSLVPNQFLVMISASRSVLHTCTHAHSFEIIARYARRPWKLSQYESLRSPSIKVKEVKQRRELSLLKNLSGCTFYGSVYISSVSPFHPRICFS